MSGVSRFDCYPSDFLNGIIGLSADEIAAYTVILMLQYDRGVGIQYVGREREISVRSGMSRARLDKAIAGLVASGKLQQQENVISNDRAVREIEKIHEKISKNRENSEKGGISTQRKFIEKHKENSINGKGRSAKPIGQPKQGPIPSSFVLRPSIEESSLRSDSPTPKNETTMKPKPRDQLSACLGAELAAEVIEHRQRMRKPLTAAAASRLAKQFIATGSPEDAARMMIDRAWQGFQADWYANAKATAGPHGRPEPVNGEPIIDLPGAGKCKESSLVRYLSEPESLATKAWIKACFGTVESCRSVIARHAPGLLKLSPEQIQPPPKQALSAEIAA